MLRSPRRRIRLGLALAAVFLLALAGFDAPAPSARSFANPVIPGDHPDPTVVRVGGSYYATATSGQWAPVFQLFRSRDLTTWDQVGAIFPRPPAWTVGHYWAPELVRWNKRMLVFYSASRRGGKPCIGVGSAARPEGPWRDRGPALCLPGGTIDASPFTDADGSRWLLYKAMGVGQGIWAVRFDERRLRAVGEPTLLIKPDARWEQGTTEGPALVRRGGQYHLFYAGGHCCRPPCTYSEGVARADQLLGPYTKDPDNPIMTGDDEWKCPGHGTLMDLGPRGLVLVHHAYRRSDRFNSRRNVVLTPVRFDAGNRARLGEPEGTPVTPGTGVEPRAGFSDPVVRGRLEPAWEWPFDRTPELRAERAGVELRCRDVPGPPAFVARQVQHDGFTAVTGLVRAPRGRAAAGLSVIDPGWVLRGVEVRDGRARQVRVDPTGVHEGPAVPLPRGGRARLRLTVDENGTLSATAGIEGGRVVAVPSGPAATGAPPTRIALTCRGTGAATFDTVRARPLG